MSLNFQQVFDRIREIGRGARARQQDLEARRSHAHQLLEAWSTKTSELRDKIERARQADPGLRCALPLDEPLDAATRQPVNQKNAMLLAADGSQIAPDRHAAVLYSLVNVGAILLDTGSGKAPEVFTDSSLLFGDELYTETGILSGDAVDLQRDIAERKKLLELANQVMAPCVALTDGPLELWGAKNANEGDYRRCLEIHKTTLSRLQAKNVTVAGYVDKPGADLIVRALEVAFQPEAQLKDIRSQHPLRGVTDRWLYAGILKAGQRSAVFGMQSGSRLLYSGDLALHFFYLNVGDGKHPSLVRVEIPRWVAEDEEQLDLLHSVLLQQCQVMGVRPYPYILHRAHEIAVVRFDEKQQVEQLLELELRKAGGEVEEISAKQSAKDLPGRTGTI
jgi:hypothetical protein